MQDRLGRQIQVGDLVTIINHPELNIKVNWEIVYFIDHGIIVEATLKNFINGEIAYVSLLNIEKEG